MKQGIIYKATNVVNGKVYIGQTIQGLSERKRGHKKESFNPNSKGYDMAFHRAIRKYGLNNFMWETVSTLYVNLLDLAETLFIVHFNSMTDKGVGYNMVAGGKSLRGELHPQYDNNKYDFYNDDGRQELQTTKYLLRNKYSLGSSNVSGLFSGKVKSVLGWRLKK